MAKRLRNLKRESKAETNAEDCTRDSLSDFGFGSLYSGVMEVKHRIETKLKSAFSPQHLEVINESHKHNVPAGSETHFKVLLVTKAFEGKSLVQRHRWIYELVADEMKNGVHALALHTHTPEEWVHSPAFRKSPPCLGGSSDEK